jgi:hypothetical protein
MKKLKGPANIIISESEKVMRKRPEEREKCFGNRHQFEKHHNQ